MAWTKKEMLENIVEQNAIALSEGTFVKVMLKMNDGDEFENVKLINILEIITDYTNIEESEVTLNVGFDKDDEDDDLPMYVSVKDYGTEWLFTIGTKF